jgi:hypothetical protein
LQSAAVAQLQAGQGCQLTNAVWQLAARDEADGQAAQAAEAGDALQRTPHVRGIVGADVQPQLLQPGQLHDGRQDLGIADAVGCQACELLQLAGIHRPRSAVVVAAVVVAAVYWGGAGRGCGVQQQRDAVAAAWRCCCCCCCRMVSCAGGRRCACEVVEGGRGCRALRPAAAAQRTCTLFHLRAATGCGAGPAATWCRCGRTVAAGGALRHGTARHGTASEPGAWQWPSGPVACRQRSGQPPALQRLEASKHGAGQPRQQAATWQRQGASRARVHAWTACPRGQRVRGRRSVHAIRSSQVRCSRADRPLVRPIQRGQSGQLPQPPIPRCGSAVDGARARWPANNVTTTEDAAAR